MINVIRVDTGARISLTLNYRDVIVICSVHNVDKDFIILNIDRTLVALFDHFVILYLTHFFLGKMIF